jgi:hypothetical protein
VTQLAREASAVGLFPVARTIYFLTDCTFIVVTVGLLALDIAGLELNASDDYEVISSEEEDEAETQEFFAARSFTA